MVFGASVLECSARRRTQPARCRRSPFYTDYTDFLMLVFSAKFAKRFLFCLYPRSNINDPRSLFSRRLGGESNGLWRVGPGVFGEPASLKLRRPETPNTAGKMSALPIFHGFQGFFEVGFAVKFAMRHPIEGVVPDSLAVGRIRSRCGMGCSAHAGRNLRACAKTQSGALRCHILTSRDGKLVVGQDVQSSTESPGIRWKSRRLPVATVSPWARAMLAMKRSLAPIMVPAVSS